MDWMSVTQVLGNVGEFISGIVVLLTLLYLTYQIRQGAHSLQRADVRSVMERFDAFFISMQDLRTSDLWIRGLDGELELPAEHWTFYTLLNRYVYAMQNLWSSVENGILPSGAWAQQGSRFAEILTTPGGAENWERIKVTLHPRFISEVEEYRENEARKRLEHDA